MPNPRADTAASRTEFSSRAFVVRMVDYRDSDRIVTLFTEESGKVSALARGARKSRKRYGAALSPYVLGSVKLKGALSGGRLATLSEIHPVESFSNIGKDVVRLALAGYFAELCRETVPDSHPEPAIFDLLLLGHRLLDQGRPTRAVVRAFELHLLNHLGLCPQLDECGGWAPHEPCQKMLDLPTTEQLLRGGLSERKGEDSGEEPKKKSQNESSQGDEQKGAPTEEERDYAFDLTLGGALCPSCARKVSGKTRRLSARSLGYMRLLGTENLQVLASSGVELPPTVNHQIRQALGPALVHLAGKPLKSLTFIDKLRRWQAPKAPTPSPQRAGGNRFQEPAS